MRPAPTSWATEALGFGIVGSDGLPSAALSQLVQPGLRRNLRRAHLLVSTVLGKHIAADPNRVIWAGEQLAARAAEIVDGAADVLAMAETATGLGGCVAAALGAPVYLHTTRRPTTVPSYVEFEEGHSHATHHGVRPSPPDILDTLRPLIVVDDETSTGATALAAIEQLHRRCPRPHYVIASLVDMRTNEHLGAAEQLATDLGTSIDAVSLAVGRVVLPTGLIEAVQALPQPQLNLPGHRVGTRGRIRCSWPASVPDGGRHGFLASDTQPFFVAIAGLTDALHKHLDPGRPVLIIGHEELMYLPLQVAKCLADKGVSVRFQSTTRSPAYVKDTAGYPLRRGYQFVACERDQFGPRFLYNGWPHDDAGAQTQYVLVVDDAGDTAKLSGPDGIEEVLAAAGHDVLTVVVGGADAAALAATRNNSR